MDMIRDDYKRGEEMEEKLIIILKDNGIDAEKNPDPYDIDVIVNLGDDIYILIEIEETSSRNWPPNYTKPNYRSKLFTMPIRKIKYFIGNKTKTNITLDDYLKKNSTIESIKEFNKLFDDNTKFVSKNDKKIRLYIKGSFELNNLCIVKSETIIKALNNTLIDQCKVNQQIKEISNKNKKDWDFKGNLWENRCVKNFKNQKRDDPVTLILGHIEEKNELIWISKDQLYDTLYKIAFGEL